ncbi:MAG: hypothetical protein SPK65_07975, partial [Succinivibrio dextrinosolvens]|nr:hypothetical protein [Succinivibrio dextrinosolvens]
AIQELSNQTDLSKSQFKVKDVAAESQETLEQRLGRRLNFAFRGHADGHESVVVVEIDANAIGTALRTFDAPFDRLRRNWTAALCRKLERDRFHCGAFYVARGRDARKVRLGGTLGQLNLNDLIRLDEVDFRLIDDRNRFEFMRIADAAYLNARLKGRV